MLDSSEPLGVAPIHIKLTPIPGEYAPNHCIYNSNRLNYILSRDTIIMKFLIDKEVNLNKQDFLKTSSYSKALSEVITSAPSDSSFTIGLFGEWGSGKSSIVRTVEEDLSKDNKIKFVVYDAWKYSNDSFRRMFLLKLQESLGFERTEKFESFYRNKTSDVAVKRKVDWKYIVSTIAVFLLGIILIYLMPSTETDTKITLTLIIAFLGILINVLGRAFSDYKVTVQEPMIFAPEQFEECFNEMVPKVLEPSSTITSITKWIKGEHYISGLEKLVIVVDNIDRCPKDKAYEMITNIKSFLSSQRQIIFLIPVDDEALKRHIIKEENNDSKEAEEFLRKFFSVTIRIKPFKRFDLYDFTNNINKENKLNFNPTTIDIVSKEFATNPRRIIQFFNDLMSELKIFELNQGVDFPKMHESLICKMLILRQEWPDYYKKISKNSSLINDSENVTDNEELSSFLKVTDSITRNEPISTIETVLSTFDRESKLSIEVIALVEKKGISEIAELVKSNQVDKSTLVDYLIERLNTGIKRKTFKTDVNNVLEILYSLHDTLPLDKDQNNRIASEIRYNLNDFFRHIGNLQLLVTYSHRLKSQGIGYLHEYITGFLEKNVNDKTDENSYSFTKSLFREYIRNEGSRNNLNKMQSLFEQEYGRSGSTLQEYELDSEQLSDVINENIISSIVSRVEAVDRDLDSYEELVYASENISFENSTFKDIITKLDSLTPTFANFSKDQVIEHLANLNLVLKHQKSVVEKPEEKEVMLAFKNKMFADRILAGRSINILSENPTEKDAEVILEFLKYIYRCSNGIVEIITNLNSIISALPPGQELVNSMLVSLKNENSRYHLIPVSSVILKDETYSKSCLELLAYVLPKKDDKGVYRMTDDLVSPKLERVTAAFSSSKSTELFDFLENSIVDERMKTILANIVTKMSRADILALPNKLQELSFDKVAEGDTIYDYQENIEFLKAIGSRGEKKHITKLVKVIVNKLQREEKIAEGIEILAEVKSLKNSDKKTLEGIVESMEDGDSKDKIMEILKRF